MPASRRHLAVPLAAVAMAFAVVRPRAVISEPPSTQPATVPADAEPVIGPIAYYVDKCARCHGDISVPYPGLTKPKNGKELEQVIDEMAAGPAQSPLDAEGLRQQTALHEAMFGSLPFVWIDPTPGVRLRGEALPGTVVTFQPAGESATDVVVTDSRFDLPRRPGTLIAKRGEKVVWREAK